MFKQENNNTESNFWISYADLMAGLLFVFILLIGAIVSKSILMREDLHKKEDRLSMAEKTLDEKRKRLNITKEELSLTTSKLFDKEKLLNRSKQSITKKNTTIKKQHVTILTQKEKIRLQIEEVEKLHRLLSGLKEDLSKGKQREANLAKTNADLNKTVILTHNSIKLKEKELERLNQLLLARNAKVDTLNGKIVILQNLINENNTTMQQKQKKLQEYVGRVVVLSNQLTNKEDELKLKDQKLADILTALDSKKTRYDDLLRKLQKQKAKIRSLTGIQLKVIAALKETLGNKINIDKNNGALRLASSILFDKGKSDLKDNAKIELARAFNEYIGALVTNEAIRPHLERIVIEGHTDSDGTYLYNIALSQKRALSVMNYLLTLPIAQKYNLKKFLVASGRAYLDPIRHNGMEDKEASRRIEINFQLKNLDAMHEIEKILDEN
jgi:chemotaxis protein MotB